VPEAAVAAAVNFRVVLPLALRVAGEKAAVMPVGRPVTEKETAELKDFSVEETVSDCEVPSGTVSEVALAVMARDGTETVSVTVAVCLSEPFVPVMVNE
jgi:hypothetical protein